MKFNKELADETLKLQRLGLPREAYEVLILLFDQCYLRGRMVEQEISRERITKLMSNFIKGGK